MAIPQNSPSGCAIPVLARRSMRRWLISEGTSASVYRPSLLQSRARPQQAGRCNTMRYRRHPPEPMPLRSQRCGRSKRRFHRQGHSRRCRRAPTINRPRKRHPFLLDRPAPGRARIPTACWPDGCGGSERLRNRLCQKSGRPDSFYGVTTRKCVSCTLRKNGSATSCWAIMRRGGEILR